MKDKKLLKEKILVYVGVNNMFTLCSMFKKQKDDNEYYNEMLIELISENNVLTDDKIDQGFYFLIFNYVTEISKSGFLSEEQYCYLEIQSYSKIMEAPKQLINYIE